MCEEIRCLCQQLVQEYIGQIEEESSSSWQPVNNNNESVDDKQNEQQYDGLDISPYMMMASTYSDPASQPVGL